MAFDSPKNGGKNPAKQLEKRNLNVDGGVCATERRCYDCKHLDDNLQNFVPIHSYVILEGCF